MSHFTTKETPTASSSPTSKSQKLSEAIQCLQILLLGHSHCSAMLEVINGSVLLIQASHSTVHRWDIKEQLLHVEANEVSEVIDEFINDASDDGCSAAAFRVLFAAAVRAASRALADSETRDVRACCENLESNWVQ